MLITKGALVQGSFAADIVMWKNVRLGRTPHESQKEHEASVAFLNVAESVREWGNLEWVDLPSHNHWPSSSERQKHLFAFCNLQGVRCGSWMPADLHSRT